MGGNNICRLPHYGTILEPIPVELWQEEGLWFAELYWSKYYVIMATGKTDIEAINALKLRIVDFRMYTCSTRLV